MGYRLLLVQYYQMPLSKTVIAICGPTASGKTDLAIHLAKKYNTQILSADSRQCFKELNIGVAKPSPAQLGEVHHYFINSHSIHETVNAVTFEQYALSAAKEVFSQNDVLILAGGTGLYVKAFLEGLDNIPPTNVNIERDIRSNFRLHGIGWLAQCLRTEDADFAERGEMENPQRMMRALAVRRSTGRSIHSYFTSKKTVRNFKVKKIFLDFPREKIYERINLRVDRMMDEGLLGEAKQLLSSRQLNALQTVGYEELFDHFDGKTTLDIAVELIKRNTRHYAKRQLTWFKKYFVDTDTEVLNESFG